MNNSFAFFEHGSHAGHAPPAERRRSLHGRRDKYDAYHASERRRYRLMTLTVAGVVVRFKVDSVGRILGETIARGRQPD